MKICPKGLKEKAEKKNFLLSLDYSLDIALQA